MGFVTKILTMFRSELAGAKKVFIKPNIVSFEPYPTTTHPDVLDALLTGLSGHELIVGDGPAVDAGGSDSVLRRSPLREVCEKHNIALTNLYSEPMRRIKSPRGYSVKVSATPLLCDYVISVPVLKVHNMLGLSGALKNQFGYLSKMDRLMMHTKIKDINKGIAEANAAAHTDLFIVDAVQTMAGAQEQRHGGCCSDLGTMIAGKDPVSIDVYGLKLLCKVEPSLKGRSNPKYVQYASEYGVGRTEYKAEEI